MDSGIIYVLGSDNKIIRGVWYKNLSPSSKKNIVVLFHPHYFRVPDILGYGTSLEQIKNSLKVIKMFKLKESEDSSTFRYIIYLVLSESSKNVQSSCIQDLFFAIIERYLIQQEHPVEIISHFYQTFSPYKRNSYHSELSARIDERINELLNVDKSKSCKIADNSEIPPNELEFISKLFQEV